MDPQDDIERKLTAARAQLVTEKPFLGALVLRLPLVKADPDWCQTTATDARSLYYNRAYIEALNLEQTKFMLAHEALHCALSHFHRRQHRAKQRWDVACDYAINSLLVADGLQPPSGALLQTVFQGMPAEQIYPYIKENPDEHTLDKHLYDDANDGSSKGAHSSSGTDEAPPPSDASTGGDRTPDNNEPQRGAPKPPPLGGAEREQLAAQWQLSLAGTAQAALRAGKLSESMARLIGDLLQPQLPWRMLLARYMTNVARTDYSFARPNRREGKALLPGLRSGCVDIVVIVDTSGSIESDELREFLTEINAIKGNINARITLHACDAMLATHGPWIFEPWEEARLPSELHGGGGTRFTPAIAWAEQLDRSPDLLLYFTDADGEFPEREPTFPVLWLVKGKKPVPWGQRVQLN
ncbi:MAG: hypothetical protein HY308_05325 [Gammaproteobacteria bacterium]|nr:hypothetical protein [Gammaproteobacteria bacterium]